VLAYSLAKGGHVAAAIATLLAFDCYFRISEFTNLLVGHVVPEPDLPAPRPSVSDSAPASSSSSSSSDAGPRVAIRLPTTKMRADESSLIARPPIARLLLRHIAGRSPLHRVFGFTQEEYRALFRSACRTLGLNGAYVPHSLRGGGATDDFTRMNSSSVDIQQIMLRGRWTAAKSLFTYCRAGQSLLLQARESPALVQAGARISASLYSSFAKVCF
jgi:hypothetical protein